MRHGAKVKQCSSEGCTNIKLSKEECALGMGNGEKVKIYQSISEGCTNRAVKGGVCMRLGAKANR